MGDAQREFGDACLLGERSRGAAELEVYPSRGVAPHLDRMPWDAYIVWAQHLQSGLLGGESCGKALRIHAAGHLAIAQLILGIHTLEVVGRMRPDRLSDRVHGH